MKKIGTIFLMTVVFLSNGSIFAEPVSVAAKSESVTEVGNKICPVSGDKAQSKWNAVYQGKRYSFCCPACIKKFKRNPKKYPTEPAKG